MQGEIGSVLALTGAPDPDNINHLEIAVSTQYLEQQMGPASGNATVSFLSNQLQIRIHFSFNATTFSL